jgi:K+-transporting ATPase ATPase A chain
MSYRDAFAFVVFVSAIAALTPWLGGYMARVFAGERHFLLRAVGGLERLIYRGAGIDATREQSWSGYLGALLAFQATGIALLVLVQMTQAWVPGNPARVANVPFPLALNTAVSFVTNTNWQAYSGEVTMSYSTQMLGLTVQNFVSAATGIAVVIGLIRGLSRRSADRVGNYWVDLVRATFMCFCHSRSASRSCSWGKEWSRRLPRTLWPPRWRGRSR